MAVDAKSILSKLRGEETERGRITLYLDKRIFAQFKKACGDVPSSRVMENFMREFVASAQEPDKKPPKK